MMGLTKLSHLEDDNGTQIYFDKEFDDTVYELLTIYEKEKILLHFYSICYLPFFIRL